MEATDNIAPMNLRLGVKGLKPGVVASPISFSHLHPNLATILHLWCKIMRVLRVIFGAGPVAPSGSTPVSRDTTRLT